MEYTIKHRGGARVGWVHVSYPLATLQANRDEILIDLGLEKYRFNPDQVVGIEKYGSIPILGWGLRIRHIIEEYPEKIIFGCIGNPERIIKEIYSSGFLPRATAAVVREKQGFPIRWEVIAILIVLWNILCLADFGVNIIKNKSFEGFGPFFLVACLVVFLFSFGTLYNKRIQAMVLKPGRNVGEVRGMLRLLALISGAFSLAILIGLSFWIIERIAET